METRGKSAGPAAVMRDSERRERRAGGGENREMAGGERESNETRGQEARRETRLPR